MQREGKVFLTGTGTRRGFALRACIVNFRTTEADLDLLLDVIAAAGKTAAKDAAKRQKQAPPHPVNSHPYGMRAQRCCALFLSRLTSPEPAPRDEITYPPSLF
ncbi:MAG: hypothetical protein U0521_14745 [Anaerolineae bacterium]